VVEMKWRQAHFLLHTLLMNFWVYSDIKLSNNYISFELLLPEAC
jgi:hypothetical protein